MRTILFSIMLCCLLGSCTVKQKPFVLEPYQGLTIKITNLKYHKSHKKMVGYVQIKNSRSDFVKFSNQELFLICDNDSTRTYMNLPGTWEIDDGLINVLAQKTVNYQACWNIDNYTKESKLDMIYKVHLERE
ncbi:MAG: hypothetical protein Q4F84_02995 [Fibrobacter sp.]|nr:hypothetical protein [Fibrobacter sp.]